MPDPNAVVQTLHELGITRNEAEVYLATLQLAEGKPVSGYGVAQSIGKDPANLSKTLASLEKLGAVRTIQEKPRLYLPISPADFTNKLIADMQDNRLRVLDQLADLESLAPNGIPLALNNREQAVQKASQILTRCRSECLLFTTEEVWNTLGTALEVLVASTEVSVRYLGLQDLQQQGIEQRIIDLPVGFSDPEPVPWIQLVVDRRTWLIASFASHGADNAPCGWWSDDPSLALVMGASMAAALENSTRLPAENPKVTAPASADPIPELPTQPFVTESPAQPTPQASPSPKEEPEDDEGLQFIIRHEED